MAEDNGSNGGDDDGCGCEHDDGDDDLGEFGVLAALGLRLAAAAVVAAALAVLSCACKGEPEEEGEEANDDAHHWHDDEALQQGAHALGV